MQAKTSNAERAERVIAEAQARRLTIATAESCTAGAAAQLLAGAPGAGDVFHGGFIVYTKQQKTIGLGVPAGLIAEHTAVSAQVAQAMAIGAIERSSADLTLSITGVLGPDPDEDGNPVGLVYFGLAKRNGPLPWQSFSVALLDAAENFAGPPPETPPVRIHARRERFRRGDPCLEPSLWPSPLLVT
jgi:PncC family amidohydrolase